MSSTKRRNQTPKKVDAKVHKREKQAESRPLPTESDGAATDDVIEITSVSPAKQRASDAVVHRATQGLIRLESRRRTRSFLRRTVIVMIVAGVLAGLGYYFADSVPTHVLKEYWEQIQDKLTLPPAAG